MKEKKDIIEKIDNTFEVKQKMPKQEKKYIYKRIVKDLGVAILITIYFIILILGFINVDNNIFLVDLKVFSISIVFSAIAIFEYAYKRDSGRFAIYGIEVLIVAITTLAGMYIIEINKDYFNIIIATISILFIIYYFIKSRLIYKKMKKEYYNGLSDIKEIVKKEKRK